MNAVTAKLQQAATVETGACFKCSDAENVFLYHSSLLNQPPASGIML